MRAILRAFGATCCGLVLWSSLATVAAEADPAPVPLLAAGEPVQWWFAYKFNSNDFASNAHDIPTNCRFGGTLLGKSFSQYYAVASSDDPHLTDAGKALIGKSLDDPLGATFDEVYSGHYYYVVWNDQFYGSPTINRAHCPMNDRKNNCAAPWGHSKGMLAWNEDGEGLVIQVTTPNWPGAASQTHPRAVNAGFPQGVGNTLGCVGDNNISNAQHFFALKLNRDDVKAVLRALDRASVVTDTSNPQVVNMTINGAPLPPDLRPLVDALQKTTPSAETDFVDVTLSSGVRLIVKPSELHAPPWQFVSWRLDGASLRTATWWASPQIPTTRDQTRVVCWPDALKQDGAVPPIGRVEIATTGTWKGKPIGLKGGENHAKIGVTTSGDHRYAIFGDLNQQGQLAGNCASSQNGRGGMFFVVNDPVLAQDVSSLIKGNSDWTAATHARPAARVARRGRQTH